MPCELLLLLLLLGLQSSHSPQAERACSELLMQR